MRYIRDNKSLKAFGKQLQKLRIQKGFTQAQLAADCNMEISQISRIERGLLNTGISQICIIAQCLEISPKDLFDFE